MKKLLALFVSAFFILSLVGCSNEVVVKKTYNGDKTYYEMSDGTWMYDGQTYQYRLEISGKMPNAAVHSTFVYLSNIEEISFEQAYKAAGLSSDIKDYFSAEEAVLVEIK